MSLNLILPGIDPNTVSEDKRVFVDTNDNVYTVLGLGRGSCTLEEALHIPARPIEPWTLENFRRHQVWKLQVCHWGLAVAPYHAFLPQSNHEDPIMGRFTYSISTVPLETVGIGQYALSKAVYDDWMLLERRLIKARHLLAVPPITTIETTTGPTP